MIHRERPVDYTTGSRSRLAAKISSWSHIPAGIKHLNSQVAECDVFLAIIGPNWLKAKDERGHDFIAIEIAAALARNIRVIPVLVDGAHMPKADELPDSLKPLARRRAVEVSHADFVKDAETMVARIREALDDKVGSMPPPRNLLSRIANVIRAVIAVPRPAPSTSRMPPPMPLNK
jgi:hypothetical protein